MSQSRRRRTRAARLLRPHQRRRFLQRLVALPTCVLAVAGVVPGLIASLLPCPTCPSTLLVSCADLCQDTLENACAEPETGLCCGSNGGGCCPAAGPESATPDDGIERPHCPDCPFLPCLDKCLYKAPTFTKRSTAPSFDIVLPAPAVHLGRIEGPARAFEASVRQARGSPMNTRLALLGVWRN